MVDASFLFIDCATYCKQNFRPGPSITAYHHFRIASESPGIVFERKNADEDDFPINILKRNANVVGTFPDRIVPVGMDAMRQWYLYEEVAPFCDNSSSACPEPAVPKPKKIKLEV